MSSPARRRRLQSTVEFRNTPKKGRIRIAGAVPHQGQMYRQFGSKRQVLFFFRVLLNLTFSALQCVIGGYLYISLVKQFIIQMLNFSEQCMDMAQSILSRNITAINEDGSITPLDGESALACEPGHAAMALGEFYRATGSTRLEGVDIVDRVAKCIMAQSNDNNEYTEDGLAYLSLGLLAFGPSKDRNAVWDKLSEDTRKSLERRLLSRTDYDDFFQIFNIAKAVARFSMGLSKKDETGKLIDRFLERIQQTSTGNYFDDKPTEEGALDGVFDIFGVSAFVFVRQSLQLHANMHLRDRKIPSLRTFAEKYLRLLPDMVRSDGLGWAYGRKIGAYGQMHCISMILQSMRDNWISEDKMPEYMDVLRRLFQFFFMTYLDQENGYLVIKDAQRTCENSCTTRMANFDAARYLCQWARLAKTIGRKIQTDPVPEKNISKYVSFDNSNRKEQGVFIYKNIETAMHVCLPLVAPKEKDMTSSLAFPHIPGIFDWPADMYMPILVPELTFGQNVTTPSYYGKRCTTGLGFRNSFFFRYDQPELITKDGKIVKGLGSCKVSWSFSAKKLVGDFIYSVYNQVTLDKFRLVVAIGAPHSEFHVPMTYAIGQGGQGVSIEKDDFQANWLDTQVVSDDPQYRSYWGKIHYLQIYARDRAMVMRPGLQYRITIAFEPDIAFAQ